MVLSNDRNWRLLGTAAVGRTQTPATGCDRPWVVIRVSRARPDLLNLRLSSPLAGGWPKATWSRAE